jgi:Fe-S cluster assembly ATP-binding protein
MGMLRVENLSLSFDDKKILHNVNIDFWDGHIHAIVGPNGAGKSTLAQTIMGLPEYLDHDGKVMFGDENISDLPIYERAQRGITLAWQEPARFTGITVEAFLQGAAKNDQLAVITNALERVGLEPKRYLSRAVDKTLSGGERKRIEVASIFVMEPKIVLMDEPDSGIDTDAIEYIFHIIHEFKRQGATVILITHSARVLQEADHAFLLCHGQVVDKGTAERMADYFKGKCIPCTHKNNPDTREAENG